MGVVLPGRAPGGPLEALDRHQALLGQAGIEDRPARGIRDDDAAPGLGEEAWRDGYGASTPGTWPIRATSCAGLDLCGQRGCVRDDHRVAELDAALLDHPGEAPAAPAGDQRRAQPGVERIHPDAGIDQLMELDSMSWVAAFSVVSTYGNSIRVPRRACMQIRTARSILVG